MQPCEEQEVLTSELKCSHLPELLLGVGRVAKENNWFSFARCFSRGPFHLLRKTVLPEKLNECLKSQPREGISGSIHAGKGEISFLQAFWIPQRDALR